MDSIFALLGCIGDEIASRDGSEEARVSGRIQISDSVGSDRSSLAAPKQTSRQ